jgi:hypothetical protein
MIFSTVPQNVAEFENRLVFVKAFVTLSSWVGGYEQPRPDLTSNHGSGDFGVSSGTTSTIFRTTNQGSRYKNLNFGLWKTVNIEF